MVLSKRATEYAWKEFELFGLAKKQRGEELPPFFYIPGHVVFITEKSFGHRLSVYKFVEDLMVQEDERKIEEKS